MPNTDHDNRGKIVAEPGERRAGAEFTMPVMK
jgi:hypothetical protein